MTIGRRLSSAAIAALVLITAACADQQVAAPATVDACPGRRFAALAAWASAGFSGAVAVHRGGEVLCSRGVGFADADQATANTAATVFSIGSITKTVTAAAALRLVDDGRLRLDDRVGRWLPDVTGALADATVLDLLVHRSGLGTRHGTDSVALTRGNALEAIAGQRLAFAPGGGYAYSNSGYTLLAMIVEEAAGTDFRSYVADEVLTVDGERLGGWWDGEPAAPGPRAVGRLGDGTTGHTGDFAGPHWALEGNGGVAMTADGLARWVGALAGGSILTEAGLATMRRTVVDHGDGTGESPGWVTVDASVMGVDALVSSGGGGDVGHEATVVWVPDDRLVLVVMANTPDVRPSAVARAAVPALTDGAALPGPVAFAEVDPATLASLTGTYRIAAGGRLEVTATDRGLRITAIGRRAAQALFHPGEPSAAEWIERHEALVASFWAGETEPGRRELAALSSELGPLRRWSNVGSVVVDGEVRTYAELEFAERTIVEWVALTPTGALAAADNTGGYPALELGPVSAREFAPSAVGGPVADVRVRFRDDEVVIRSDGAVLLRGTR